MEAIARLRAFLFPNAVSKFVPAVEAALEKQKIGIDKTNKMPPKTPYPQNEESTNKKEGDKPATPLDKPLPIKMATFLLSTASYYSAIIDSLEPPALECVYSFLLFDPAEFVLVDDLVLLAYVDDDDDQDYSTEDRIHAYCKDMQSKFLLVGNKAKKQHFYALHKSLYETTAEHFRKKVITDATENPTGINLLIAVALGYIKADEADDDQRAVSLLQRAIAASPKSSLWCRKLLTNYRLVRFLYSKCPEAVLAKDAADQTALSIVASQSDDVDPVEFLLEICPDLTDSDAKSAFMSAVERGSCDVARYLHERFADIHLNTNGKTTLMLAAKSGDLSILHFAFHLDENAISSVDPETGDTALSLATRNNNFGAILFLGDKYPKAASLADIKGRLPLFHAASNGDLDVVQFLFEKHPDAVMEVDNMGRACLSAAAESGNIDTINFLYEQWPNAIYTVEKDTNRTVLSFAASSGNIRALELLHCLNPDAIIVADTLERLPFLWAVKTGDLASAAFLLDCFPAAVTNTDKETNSPAVLMIAANNGSSELIKFLLELDPESIKATDSDGRTALSYAVEFENLDLAMFLANLYPEAVSIADNQGRLPIFHAIVNGDTACTEFLYDLNPTGAVAIDETDNKSLLSLAIDLDHYDVVKFLYSVCPNLAKQRDVTGRIPLFHAITSNRLEIVKFLTGVYSKGIMETGDDGKTPIAAALEEQGFNFDMIKFLYEKYPEGLEVQDSENLTSFFKADSQRLRNNVRNLVESAMKAVDSLGMTPFTRAVQQGKLEVAEFLYEKYPEALELVDRYGLTPLAIAAYYGQCSLIEFLHEKTPEAVETANYEGKLPLMLAAEQGHLDMMKMLFELCPEAIKRVDKENRTALFLASQEGHVAIIEFLFDNFPEAYEIVDTDERTPLTVAVQRNQIEAMNILQEKSAKFEAGEFEEEIKSSTADNF